MSCNEKFEVSSLIELVTNGLWLVISMGYSTEISLKLQNLESNFKFLRFYKSGRRREGLSRASASGIGWARERSDEV